MEDILDEASLEDSKVSPLKEIKYLRGKNTYSKSCYLKEGLVSIMLKYYNKDSQVEFYEWTFRVQCRRNNITVLHRCPHVWVLQTFCRTWKCNALIGHSFLEWSVIRRFQIFQGRWFYKKNGCIIIGFPWATSNSPEVSSNHLHWWVDVFPDSSFRYNLYFF